MFPLLLLAASTTLGEFCAAAVVVFGAAKLALDAAKMGQDIVKSKQEMAIKTVELQLKKDKEISNGD